MKTDVEIRQEIYRFVKESLIGATISGKVSYVNDHVDGEDCMISVPDNENGQFQEVFVYVRVYVPNINSNGISVENIPRIKELEQLCQEVLKYGSDGDNMFELKTQTSKPVNGKNEHCISNKLFYKQFNY